MSLNNAAMRGFMAVDATGRDTDRGAAEASAIDTIADVLIWASRQGVGYDLARICRMALGHAEEEGL